MLNIFAVGCSFTWGESLQFFSGLDSVQWTEYRQNFYDSEKTLDEAQLNFIKENRWISQLSKKLGVEHITQSKNGGSNLQSLIKAQYFYEKKENLEKYKICIIQITQSVRDPIIFKLPNGDMISVLDMNGIISDDYLDISDDKLINNSYTYFYDKCHNFFNYLESKEIHCYCITYPKDSVEPLLKHPLSKYHIELLFEDKKFYSIDDLVFTYPNLCIENYFAEKNLNKGDKHITLEGHKIISDSIYNKIIYNN